MVNHSFIHFSSSLLLLAIMMAAIVEGTQAVDFTVTNNALSTSGGIRFRDEIGDDYAKQTLDSAAQFIWGIFQENSDADRKDYTEVTLFVEDLDGVAYTTNNEIHLSSGYVGDYSGDVKTEITGVLYHESTHVWQWNGNGQANGGLIEGIADYVRLKAGYASSSWGQPGEGDSWDTGYDTTAYFLDYLNSLKDGFLADLNSKMKSGYSDQYFDDIFGKSVDQLWNDYKAKYSN